MNKILSIIGVLITIELVILVSMTFSAKVSPGLGGYGADENIATANATSTVYSIGGINAVNIVPATTTSETEKLQRVEICLASSTADAIVQYATNTAIKTGKGHYLQAKDCWESVPSRFLFRGGYWAVATTGVADASTTVIVNTYYSQ